MEKTPFQSKAVHKSKGSTEDQGSEAKDERRDDLNQAGLDPKQAAESHIGQ